MACYVVRIGNRRGGGPYVTSFDGESWTASTKQANAYRWTPRDRCFAELAAIGIGDARVVRLRRRGHLVPRRGR